MLEIQAPPNKCELERISDGPWDASNRIQESFQRPATSYLHGNWQTNWSVIELRFNLFTLDDEVAQASNSVNGSKCFFRTDLFISAAVAAFRILITTFQREWEMISLRKKCNSISLLMRNTQCEKIAKRFESWYSVAVVGVTNEASRFEQPLGGLGERIVKWKSSCWFPLG